MLNLQYNSQMLQCSLALSFTYIILSLHGAFAYVSQVTYYSY